MKGTTHAMVGIAAASILSPLVISDMSSGPEKLLTFVFAYTGSLICDIDTETSTMSNMIAFIKSKHIKAIMYIIFATTLIFGTIYFWSSKYIYTFITLMLLGGLTLNRISSKVIKLVRKAVVIAVSMGMIIIGIYYGHPPIALIGIYILALVCSPHRGYSHSLVAVAAAFFILKYTFSFYKVPDYYSTSFCVGMLSHIVADMFTERGVTLFFPLGKRIHIPFAYELGSVFEGVLSSVSIILIVLLNIGHLKIF